VFYKSTKFEIKERNTENRVIKARGLVLSEMAMFFIIFVAVTCGKRRKGICRHIGDM
jgi:hypothetical protein